MSQSSAVESLNFSQLLRAAEGLTQWRPMVLAFATMVFSGLLLVAGQYIAMNMGQGLGMVMMLVILLLSLVIGAAGLSGVGVLLMDRAKNIPPRSMLEALLFGLFCLPKFIGFFLVLLCATLALAIGGALLYFVCKIPGLGPVLLFLVHPVLVVTAGAFFISVTWVCLPLFTPAVWEGRGFKECLSLVVAVARQRLLRVVMLLLALYVVVMVIGALLTAALLPGYAFMTGLAGSIVGSGFSGAGLPSMAQLMHGGGRDGGYMYAGLLATLLIAGVAVTLMMQVYVMGMNLVYLSATEGLDINKERVALEGGLAQVAQKAREAQERARDAAARASAASRTAMQPTPGATEPALPAAATAAPASAHAPVAELCANCHTPVAPHDVFCGHCGHRQ